MIISKEFPLLSKVEDISLIKNRNGEQTSVTIELTDNTYWIVETDIKKIDAFIFECRKRILPKRDPWERYFQYEVMLGDNVYDFDVEKSIVRSRLTPKERIKYDANDIDF